MRALHTIASVRRDAGGPSRTVPALCDSLRDLGVEVSLLTRDDPGAQFRRRFDELARSAGPLVVHDHGVWLPTNHLVASGARRASRPRIVSPRGMLEPWSLRYRALKKRIAWYGYQRRDLQRADCLHATAAAEAEQFRRLGLTAPIAVIPNGVAAPLPAERRRDPDRIRRALFLSRIHPKKGLLDLVDAWRRVAPSGWGMTIAGPDEGGHRAEVEAAVDAAGLRDQFTFAGPLDDEAKWEAYRAADLFVLPTFSENFGVVVAEALGCGVPAITTRAAPWRELESADCGWWIDVGSAPLATALTTAMALSDDDRRAMGRRGRAMVEERFAWPGIAERMRAVYQWLLDGGRPPPTVG